MRVFGLAVYVFSLGCAARGPSVTDVADQISTVPDGMARLVFLRTTESALYIARDTAISLDGACVGATGYGEFLYADVAQGAHRLRADTWDMPGRCELLLEAVTHQTYYFQVDPREESFGAFALSSFVVEMISDGVLSSLVGGRLGSAAESYGKACGGGFRLYPVDPVAARSRLRELTLAPLRGN